MPGLLDALFGGGNPQAQVPAQAQPQSGFGRLLAPEIGLPMAAALLGGQGNMRNFANAFGAAGTTLKEQADQNKTLAFLQQNAPELAQAVGAGMPITTAWQAYMKQREAQTPGKATYSVQPIYGTDENGNAVLGTMGNDGSFKKVDTGGFNISTGVDKIDLGTHWGLIDKRSGQLVGSMPKDNEGQAADIASGKARGEAIASYRSMVSKMPGLEQVVSDLDKLADEATYTYGGVALDEGRRQLGMEPRDSAVARTKYIAMVDNQILPLLRDTFGAQFTKEEGDSLRATLGDPYKSPAEKKAVLQAFIAQKRRDVEALALQSMQGTPPPQGGINGPVGGGNRASSGVRWSIEP